MAAYSDGHSPQDLFSKLSRILRGGDPCRDNCVRQEARRISMLLTASLQDPHELAFEICFFVGIQIGLFQAIADSAGPVSASELAAKTGSEQLIVVRLLRVITGLGLVAEIGKEIYQALPITEALTSPMIRAAHTHFWHQGTASLLQLPSYLSTHNLRCPTNAQDGVFQRAFSTDLDAFSYWRSQPPSCSVLDNFNFLMTCIRGKEAAWLSWFPIRERLIDGTSPGEVVIVDVGGGRGHDLLAFKSKIEEYAPKDGRYVLEDLPAIIQQSENLDQNDIERVEYDFFTAQPITDARVYYFAHIFHDWSDEACVNILRCVKDAMRLGYSKLLLYEFILPDTNCPLLQAGFDLQMMCLHAGMERTKAQWKTLLEGEGFKIIKFWTAPSKEMEGIIEAEVRNYHVDS